MLRHNTALETLGLGDCCVSAAGAAAIGGALRENTTLKGL
eukprot:gene48229-36057_t